MRRGFKSLIIVLVIVVFAVTFLFAGMYINKHYESKKESVPVVENKNIVASKAVNVKVDADKEKALSLVKQQLTVDGNTVEEKLKKLVNDYSFKDLGWVVNNDGRVTYTYASKLNNFICTWAVDLNSNTAKAISPVAISIMTESDSNEVETSKYETYNGIQLDLGFGSDIEKEALKKTVDGFIKKLKEKQTDSENGYIFTFGRLNRIGFTQDNSNTKGGIYLQYSYIDSIKDIDLNKVYTFIYGFKMACADFITAELPQYKDLARFIDFDMVSATDKKGNKMVFYLDGHTNIDLQPSIIYFNDNQVNFPKTISDFGLNQRGFDTIKSFLENK